MLQSRQRTWGAEWLSAGFVALAASAFTGHASGDAVLEAATTALHEERGVGHATQIGLAADLKRYARNQEALDAWRADALERAIERMAAEAESGQLEDAATAIIEAHAIAENPADVLERPDVVALVNRIDASARGAEAAADFVTAASLFGRLNLLYEWDDRFKDDAERVQHHVGLVGLYRPTELARQIRERDRRLGRDLAPVLEEADDGPQWQTRLAGINRSMAAKAMVRAVETHILDTGYGEVVAGGLATLRALAETPELRVEFPGLLDEAPRQAWADRLVELESQARSRGNLLARDEAEEILAEALDRSAGLVPESVAVHEFSQGALASLDPFTGMYWPSDLDELRRATQGAFFGVGIRISLRDLALTVSSPLANTPAAAAGLQAGDEIVSVDGRSTAGWGLPRAVRAITGPEGTEVVLGVRREGEEEVREVAITRSRIDLDSVQGWELRPAADGMETGWNFWLDRDAGIAYARVTQFLPQTADELNAALDACTAEGELKGLIIDLRFNPGGLLGAAIEVADRFVPGGPLLETIDGDGVVRDKYNARKRGTLTDLPLAILINRGSASAAEIVAGVFVDTGRAVVIGERSYGKGSVQNVFWNPGEWSALPPRWGMKVTTHHYRLPGGHVIHRVPGAERWGIDPTLEVPVPDQVVAWQVELRQELDVLRGDRSAPPRLVRSHPAVRRIGLEPLLPDDDDARETVEVPGVTPEDLLNFGLDPQLEAALLTLQTAQVHEAALR